MPYKLKILSPLHIGCGETYSGLTFIIDRGKFYYIDSDIIFNFLSDKKVQHFVRWIEESTREIEVLEKNISSLRKQKTNVNKSDLDNARKKEREIKRQFTLWNYMRMEKLNLKELLEKSSYSAGVIGSIYNDVEINPFIKQMHRPYIPGSEIKGAIRTAVLYGQLVDNPDLMMFLKNKLTKFRTDNASKIEKVRNSSKPDREKKDLGKQMKEIEYAFQEEVFNSVKGDAKYDVMKYITVGDSELLDADKVLAVSRTEVFTQQRTGRPSYSEFIIPGNIVSLTLLAIEANKSRMQKLERMAFTDRQKQIVSGMNAILDYCFRFSSDLLQEEISYFNNQHKGDIVARLEEIKSQNSRESPVFRIGKDEGFNSLTVGMAIKKMAPDLYENVLIHATKGKSYDFGFPKSRKIVQWNGKELTVGWVQLLPADKANIHESNTTASIIKLRRNTSKLDLSGLKDKFGGQGTR